MDLNKSMEGLNHARNAQKTPRRPQTAPFRRGIQHCCPGSEGLPGWIHNTTILLRRSRRFGARTRCSRERRRDSPGLQMQITDLQGRARNSRGLYIRTLGRGGTRPRRQPSTGARAGLGGWIPPLPSKPTLVGGKRWVKLNRSAIITLEWECDYQNHSTKQSHLCSSFTMSKRPIDSIR